VAAGGVDRRDERRGGRHAQAAAAIVFRDQRGEKTRLRERRDELGRIGALAVEVAPIFAWKLGAKGANGLADLREVLVRGTTLGLGHRFQTALAIVSRRRGLRRRYTSAAPSFASLHRIPGEHVARTFDRREPRRQRPPYLPGHAL